LQLSEKEFNLPINPTRLMLENSIWISRARKYLKFR
jgi:hypothetical protein